MLDYNSSSFFENIIGWVFSGVFIAIGLLTIWLVHIVPGTIYLIFSLVYLPPISIKVQSKLGYNVSMVIKVILGLVVLWGTLAVGDLAEVLGL